MTGGEFIFIFHHYLKVYCRIIRLLLGEAKLDLQGLGHLWGRGAGKSELDLHTVIDEPLQSSQGTDHNDPRSETSPHSSEAKGLGRRANGGALGFVHVGHNSVGRVGHNSAEDTSDVTSGECDQKLLALGAFSSRLGHNILVKSLDSLLEAGELHHGVGDLATPQRSQGLVETVDALGGIDLWSGLAQGGGEGSGGRSLHTNLTTLHGGQSNVGEELSAGRSSQVKRCTVQVGVLLAHSVTVNVLEHLVEAELAQTLGGVADGGGSPTKEEASDAGIGDGDLESISKRLVVFLVHLKSALDKIKWGDSSVSNTTGQDTTEGAQSKVLVAAKLTAVLLSGSGDKLALLGSRLCDSLKKILI